MKDRNTLKFQAWNALSRRCGKSMIALLLGFAALLPQVARAEDDDNRSPKLRFFKNYFVTGDSAVAGVGLRGKGVNGLASGVIDMKTSVPVGADPIAAFLYWQTVETSTAPAAIKGSFRGKAIVGLPIGSLTNPACWGGDDDRAPTNYTGRVYRADVLRYLAIDSNNNVRIANGQHSVQLPDGGTGSSAKAPFTNGATLVVIYRIVVPGNPMAAPLRAITIYDGASTISRRSEDFSQNIRGFYQASATPHARLTAIAGNGAPDFKVSLEVNDAEFEKKTFVGAQGPRWDNPSFNIPLSKNASSLTVHASADDDGGCLTWAAMIVSTNVTDSDGDGLLDTWESNGLHFNPGTPTTAATFGGCADYRNEPCVNLPKMGAVNGQKDIFVEMDWLHGVNQGFDHTHMPKLDALTQVATAFKNQGVHLHFDVGNNYQSSSGPDMIFVPAGYAQGGEVIEESSLSCTVGNCNYHEPYAVLSFKKGFSGVRDGYPALKIPSHFSRLRKDIFHYALFAHALAGPFGPDGKPISQDPKTISGVADRPGGDFMITLGLWRSDIKENDQVGSALVQAGTIMHELGHNLGLSHAGNTRTPNCVPNYPSVMNYLYQTRGLTLPNGNQRIDFSPGTLLSLNENTLSESAGLGALTYRIRYYGPLGRLDPKNSAAKVHCDGSAITDGALLTRLENSFPSFIDWDHNGVLTPGTFALDVNFSGKLGDGANGSSLFTDSNDWASLNLQQIGARLNVNGLSTDVGVNDLGVNDLGVNDLGVNDLGVNDLGVNDLGVNDLGVNDLGAIDGGDIDYETAVLSTIDPPPGPTPDCPTCGLSAVNKIDRITLSWTAPATGSVANYNVYRVTTDNPLPVIVTTVLGGQAITTTDVVPNGDSILFNVNYTFFVTSVVLRNGITAESGASNTANGIVKRLFVAGLNVTRVYLDLNPTLFTISGLDTPAPSAAVCTTTATSASDAGSYPIVCTGPATTTNPINGIAYTNGSLTITKRPQTITFAALAKNTYTYLDADFAVTATSDSTAPNLAVIFNAGPNCSVNVNSVKITGAGSCTITARQVGNNNYQPAPDVSQTFTILKAKQTITFGALDGKIFGNGPFALTATTTSPLTLSYTVTPASICTASGATVTINGAGSCAVTATQGGDSNYLAAVSATQSFTIVPRPQAITFASLTAKTFGDPDFSVSATSDSGIAVVFTATGDCTIAGNLVHLVAVGTCKITASVPFSTNFVNATPVDSSFTIAPVPVTALNVLWYTGGGGTAGGTASGTADYQNRITALGASAVNNAPFRSWNIVFWAGGTMPTPTAGVWNVLVVASTIGPWNPSPNFTDLQTAIKNSTFSIKPAVNRVMLTGIDADWHYLNTPGTARGFNGPTGFLLNSINWAGSGTGMGLVQMGEGVDFAFGGFTSSAGVSDTVVIPTATSGYAINSGLTGPGLSGWNSSVHSDFGRSYSVSSLWTGIHLDGSDATNGVNFVTIVSAPADGALKPVSGQ